MADDLILAEKNELEYHNLYRDLCAATKPCNLRIKEAKLALWSIKGGPHVLAQAHMMFLGVMPARDRMAAPKHWAEQTWANIWSINKFDHEGHPCENPHVEAES